ncbi:MAG TPA: hypothetical protein VFI65_04995 [Streptosporangiaceae bacterium]|nr:hypothetical protein [Streptosporangiaceae bacterium]
MRSLIARWCLLAASLAGLVGSAGAMAGPALAAPAAGPRPVLLITGTRLAPGRGPGGRPIAAVLPSSTRSRALVILNVAGRVMDIPVDVLPFLGRGLDPSLFDVSALRRLERDGRLPVLVSYQGPAPKLPGITITRAIGGIASGYLTARSASRFGVALSRQFAADHDRASYGTDGLFVRRVTIALAGAAKPSRTQPPRPSFVEHTLTVHGIDLAGRPDTGDEVMVFNADRAARFDDPIESGKLFFHGIAKLSVPAGHYWAIGTFFSRSGAVRVAVVPQFTVPANAATASTRVDERTATSKISVSVPRPAVPQMLAFTAVRGDGAGSSSSFAFQESGNEGLAIWVSPTRKKPAVGTLRSFTQAQLASPPGPDVPYVYDLDFPGPVGHIPAQHFAVRPSSLATVTERYIQDKPSDGFWAVLGGSVPELNAGIDSFVVPGPLRLPGQQIQYMTGNPAVLWSTQYWEFAGNAAAFGGQFEDLRSRRPGRHVTEEWGRYPLHPEPDVSLANVSLAIQSELPSAARAGDVLSLAELAFGDNTPGHIGPGIELAPGAKATGRWEIDQNGVRLATGDGFTAIPPVRLSARPSVVSFTLTASRTSRRYVLSASSSTTWIWRSRRAPAARVSSPWECRTTASITAGLTRQCVVQPMLTLNYHVAGLDITGATPPGQQVIDLTVGHIQLARAAAITGARMRVSFDGGVTWHAAQVAATGPGRFRVTFTAPAHAFVTLRTTATDRAGGAITETITRAYATTG